MRGGGAEQFSKEIVFFGPSRPSPGSATGSRAVDVKEIHKRA